VNVNLSLIVDFVRRKCKLKVIIEFDSNSTKGKKELEEFLKILHILMTGKNP